MHYYPIFLLPLILCSEMNWNYFAGGNDWHNIWETCSSTQGQQSPIDIHYENVTTVTQAIIYFEQYAKNIVTKIENNGYFLKADFPWMVVEMNDHTGDVRRAQCFTAQFHAPSEHIIEGNRFAMVNQKLVYFFKEMQITCEDVLNNGKYINIALLFESERFQECPLIDNFAAAALNLKHQGTKAKISMNFEEAFKEALEKNEVQEYYTYTGSFTSPPCHHSVEWAILAKPIKISDQSLSNFQALWSGDKDFAGGSGNYRNLQLLHDTTKFLKGRIQSDLKPVNLIKQMLNLQLIYNYFEKKRNNELNKKEDTESDEYYQKKIEKQLQHLEGQRKINEYQIKAEKKAKYLEEQIKSLKQALQQEGDGSNAEHLSEKVKEKQVELEKFLENCSEYNENCFLNSFINFLFLANCNVDIPTLSKGTEGDLDDDDDDEANQQNPNEQENSQELENINNGNDDEGKPKEKILITHDGQEIEMEVPEELSFLQIRNLNQKNYRKKNK